MKCCAYVVYSHVCVHVSVLLEERQRVVEGSIAVFKSTRWGGGERHLFNVQLFAYLGKNVALIGFILEVVARDATSFAELGSLPLILRIDGPQCLLQGRVVAEERPSSPNLNLPSTNTIPVAELI